jgi:1,4-dihydroxy-2-naphthoate octaprenyltransferase
MQTLAAFIRLSRLKFLAAGFLGFALGAAIAAYEGYALSLASYLCGQLLVTAFQLMTHYANDYFDRVADANAIRTEFSGGSGSLVDGTLTPRTALLAALVCAAIGIAMTSAFFSSGSPAMGTIGVLIGVLAWSYSAPPLRLHSRGFGELTTAIVVGALVPLGGFVTFAPAIDGLALFSALPPALAVFAMMLAVQWPDVEADRLAGKHNLLVRYGPEPMGRLAAACAASAVACLALIALLAMPKAAIAFAVLLAFPATAFSKAVRDASRPAAEVAGRGVAFAFLTLLCSLLAYVAVTHP